MLTVLVPVYFNQVNSLYIPVIKALARKELVRRNGAGARVAVRVVLHGAQGGAIGGSD